MKKNDSKLEELEKKIYSRKEAPIPGREIRPRERIEKEWEMENSKIQSRLGGAKLRNWPIYLFIFLFLFGVGFYWYYVRQTFQKTDVILSVSGPEAVTSGEQVRFRVNYKNNSRTRLLNAVLTFNWPTDSEIISSSVKELGDVLSQKEDVAAFEGRFFGPRDEEKQIEVILTYQPENFNVRFETKQIKKVVISSTPIFLSFQMPARTVSGKEFEFNLEYANKSDVSFSNLEIRLDYPSNFSFSQSEPDSFDSGAKFNILKLTGREINKIKIKGLLRGQEGDVYNFRASVGIAKGPQFLLYAKDQTSLKLSSAILWVFQTLEDSRDFSASPGDTLQYKIGYKNTTDIPINNVSISAELQSTILDFRTLNSPWSVFDSRTNTITWSSVSLPDLTVLTPFEEGKVQFTIKVKDPPPVKKFNDRNFTITSIVKIAAVSVPESLAGLPLGNEDRLETKVNSKASLNARGYYYESTLLNTGPLPPKVSQQTTYTLSWQIANYSNDLENLKVEAILPAYVEWLGKINPSDENINYDKISGQLTWLIDRLPAGIGIISPAKQIAFQVAIVPAFNQIDQVLELISESKLTAQDMFTSQPIQASDQSINTTLPDDSNVGYQKGKVVP